jgi:hypothetical protein
MQRPTSVPLNRVKFPLTLADGLRTTFADVVAIPLPAQLALTRRNAPGASVVSLRNTPASLIG